MNCFTGNRRWVLRLWKRPFWFSKKVNVTLSLNWSEAAPRWMFSVPDLLHRPFAIGKNKFSFLGEISPLSHSVFLSRFPMRPSFPTPQGLRSVRHPSKFPPRTERIRGTIQVKLSFQIDGFVTDLSQSKGDTQPMNQMEQSVLQMVAQSVSHRESSHQMTFRRWV